MSKYQTRGKYGQILATVDGEVFTHNVLGRTYSFGVGPDGVITELSSGWRVCDVRPGHDVRDELRRAVARSPTGFVTAVRKACAQALPPLPPLPAILPPLPPLP